MPKQKIKNRLAPIIERAANELNRKYKTTKKECLKKARQLNAEYGVLIGNTQYLLHAETKRQIQVRIDRLRFKNLALESNDSPILKRVFNYHWTMQQRSNTRTDDLFAVAVPRCNFRSSVHGSEHNAVDHAEFGISPTICGARVRVHTQSKRGQRCPNIFRTFTLPHDWRVRVVNKGLAILSEGLCLWADHIVTLDQIKIYRACWVSQGRGYQLRTWWGHLARHPLLPRIYMSHQNVWGAVDPLRRELESERRRALNIIRRRRPRKKLTKRKHRRISVKTPKI